MDPKFQTSFIPKKQPTPSFGGMGVSKLPHKGTSVFMVLAVLVFLVSAGGLGGAYAWKIYLTSSQVSYKNQLAERESKFDTKALERLKAISVQIDTARQLLGKHVAMSQIFDMIGRITVSNVQFNSMDVGEGSDQNGTVTITMKGQGTNLAAVASQSDVMGQLEKYGLSDILKNPIISDPVLDTNGSVSFGFSATIDPSSLSYASLVTQ